MNGFDLRRLGERCVAQILPRTCGLCGAGLATGTICAGCRDDLPWIRRACVRCALPLAGSTDTVCGTCQRREPPFFLAHAPVHYAFPIAAVVKAFKFRRKLYLGRLLADLMRPWLAERRGCFDALIPVPLHRWRHAARGFNQAAELAVHLRATTGLPIRHCVRRVRRTRTQSDLDAAERRRNVKGAFVVAGSPRCRHALLVDDVLTTGETCRELSLVLRRAGVEEVSVLAIARASGI